MKPTLPQNKDDTKKNSPLAVREENPEVARFLCQIFNTLQESEKDRKALLGSLAVLAAERKTDTEVRNGKLDELLRALKENGGKIQEISSQTSKNLIQDSEEKDRKLLEALTALANERERDAGVRNGKLDDLLKELRDSGMKSHQISVNANAFAMQSAARQECLLAAQLKSAQWAAESISWFTIITFLFLPLGFFSQVS